MREVIVRVFVDFPALAAIAEWLQGNEQKKVDQLEAQIDTSISSVTRLSAGLKASVDQSK